METAIRTDDPTHTILASNGWKVLAYTEQFEAAPGWRRSGIAILYRGGGHDPFTTHRLIQTEEGEWFAEAGTYHRALDDALIETYVERVNR